MDFIIKKCYLWGCFFGKVYYIIGINGYLKNFEINMSKWIFDCKFILDLGIEICCKYFCFIWFYREGL